MSTEKDLMKKMREKLREIKQITQALNAQLPPSEIAKLKQDRKKLKKEAEDILDELAGE